MGRCLQTSRSNVCPPAFGVYYFSFVFFCVCVCCECVFLGRERRPTHSQQQKMRIKHFVHTIHRINTVAMAMSYRTAIAIYLDFYYPEHWIVKIGLKSVSFISCAINRINACTFLGERLVNTMAKWAITRIKKKEKNERRSRIMACVTKLSQLEAKGSVFFFFLLRTTLPLHAWRLNVRIFSALVRIIVAYRRNKNWLIRFPYTLWFWFNMLAHTIKKLIVEYCYHPT